MFKKITNLKNKNKFIVSAIFLLAMYIFKEVNIIKILLVNIFLIYLIYDDFHKNSVKMSNLFIYFVILQLFIIAIFNFKI